MRYGVLQGVQMANEWKVIQSGFLDGFSAILLMFRQVRVPGSPSEELIRVTTPDSLAECHAVDPALADAILQFREEALRRDRNYNRMVRVCGCLELAVTIAAVCFLVLHYRH